MAEFYMPKYKYKPPTEEQLLRHLADMSYKSPVEVFSQGVQMKFEGDVMQAIHSYGISVDKDELVKALQYDRDQYKKGFADGCICRTDTIKADVAREIFEVVDKLVITKVFPSGALAILIDDGEYKKLKKEYTEGE